MKHGYVLQLLLVEKIDISTNEKVWIFTPKNTNSGVKLLFHLVNTKQLRTSINPVQCFFEKIWDHFYMKCGCILQLLLVTKVDIFWSVDFRILAWKWSFLMSDFYVWSKKFNFRHFDISKFELKTGQKLKKIQKE